MEPKKVRVHELSLVYYVVRSLVHKGGIDEPKDDQWPNLGSFFAEHLFKLKMKPFQTAGAKKETVGTLLTPIFIRWGIPLDQAMVIDQRVYMDAVHLTSTTSTQWLKDSRFWSFRDGEGTHLIELPRRSVTDIAGDLARNQFHPDPATMPRRCAAPRATRAHQEQPEAPLPPFPDIHTCPHASMMTSSAS